MEKLIVQGWIYDSVKLFIFLVKFHFSEWCNERSKTFKDRLPGYAVVAGGCVEGGVVVAVWKGGEKEHKGESSLMIKVSSYSLYSDKKEIPVPPDSCPLRENQSNCWSPFVVDMSMEWTKLQCKLTLRSVTKGLLHLPFSLNMSLFLIYRCLLVTRNVPFKLCLCLMI